MKQQSLVLTCVGLNHQTSPIEEREQLAFSSDALPNALAVLGEVLRGAAIISTCNRTELYATVPHQPAQGPRLIKMLNSVKGTRIDASHFYFLQHDEAVHHLFRVAAGVDSMVLGEPQILGQVRDAMSAATDAGTLNGVLSRVLHNAIAVGKRARTETHISRNAVSVGSAAVALARKTLGDLSGKTVLVISAGSMGKLAARSLAENGGARIVVANRTRERARDLAHDIGPNAEAVSLSQLDEALASADIVISGTGAGGFVLGPDNLRPVMAGRNGHGLLFIDIAVPRDIDPAVRDIPGVHLFDIDDIEDVTSNGLSGRKRELHRVEAIIAEEEISFLEWWRSLDVVPVIAALRKRAEAIRRAELDRTIRRLPALDDDARRRIEAMTAAIVKKMLDRPISRLKDGADTGLYIDAVQDLFDIQTGTGTVPSHQRGG